LDHNLNTVQSMIRTARNDSGCPSTLAGPGLPLSSALNIFRPAGDAASARIERARLPSACPGAVTNLADRRRNSGSAQALRPPEPGASIEDGRRRSITRRSSPRLGRTAWSNGDRDGGGVRTPAVYKVFKAHGLKSLPPHPPNSLVAASMVGSPARRADPMRRGKREGGEQNREKDGEDGPHMLIALIARCPPNGLRGSHSLARR
jgi:hypothetical protein